MSDDFDPCSVQDPAYFSEDCRSLMYEEAGDTLFDNSNFAISHWVNHGIPRIALQGVIMSVLLPYMFIYLLIGERAIREGLLGQYLLVRHEEI